MSGGERQRVAIARALINSPGLLLCDEPTGNLDRESGEVVVSLLLELACEQNTTVLMVTHNAAHAARFARRMRLEYGRLIAEAGEET
jgi:ABC-type lipoprotein export system ATPase subunit